jgi:hypothetical protein
LKYVSTASLVLQAHLLVQNPLLEASLYGEQVAKEKLLSREPQQNNHTIFDIRALPSYGGLWATFTFIYPFLFLRMFTENKFFHNNKIFKIL